jgi:BirA family transcriptional regulator, biotin operon repressor / biotin---[acetyl-CoA-carboxylase] ligase
MNEVILRRCLANLPIPEVLYFDSIGSTNDEALRWVEEGARDGSLVTADMQTSGRGRLGRKWVTEPGVALAFSLILRPAPWEIERLGLLSPLGALAVSQALEDTFRIAPQIKWPNDVLLRGRKMCGILLEASWLGDQLQAVVIGIGVNVLKGAVPPADMLLFPATSLEDELARPVEREPLLAAFLKSFFLWREQIASLGFLQAWENRLAYIGEWVRVEHGADEPVVGQVLGIDPAGNLRLQTHEGDEVHVTAGDVRLRPVSKDESL